MLIPAFAVDTAFAQVSFPPGEIYFSPETRLEDKFVSFIARAQGTIFFCAAELSSEKVTEALIDAKTRRMLPVRVVIYKPEAANNLLIDKLLTYQIEVVLAENPAGFDYNFCMIDYNAVYLSSAAFTYAAMNQDYNYAMIISNIEKFATNFQYEFVEMLEGHYFGTASPQNTQFPNISWNGATLDTAYLPEDLVDSKMSSIISKAGSKIRIMAPQLKNSLITDNILGKKNTVSDILALFEYGTDNASKQEYETFRRAGIYAVQNKTSPKIGSSVAIIDNQYVMLFGANKAKLNTTTADSAFITINSPQIASMFNAYFDTIMQKNTADIVLKGQVVNSSNNLPLEGARIYFMAQNAETYTDYLGWYEFKGELAEEFLVMAEREYYFSKEIIFSKKNGTRLDFLLSPIISYNNLSGFVIDTFTRNPISGCGMTAVYIQKPTGTRTYIRTNSNEKGFFTFPALPVGSMDVEAAHPNYQKRVLSSFSVTAGSAISLQDPLALTPNYLITAYPNPIFEDNILINIRDSNVGGEVPRVTIKQNNYIDISVNMRIAASADLNNIYVGNYIMKRGYYGNARINVNGGASYKDVAIDFLEAYKKYTYQSAARSALSGVALNIGAGEVTHEGFVSVQQDLAPAAAGDLAYVGSAPVSVGFSKNFAMARGDGSFIELPVNKIEYEKSTKTPPAGRPSIYYYDESSGKWQWRLTSLAGEGQSGEVKLRASFDRAGKYCVLTDNVPPVVGLKKYSDGSVIATISDGGSGVDENSAGVVSDAGTAFADNVEFVRTDKNNAGSEFRIKNILEMARFAARIVFRDRSGNAVELSASEISRQASPAASTDRSVQVYPNPCRNFAKFRIKAGSDESVSISIYDSAAHKVLDLCEDINVSGQMIEVNLNTSDISGFNGGRFDRMSNSTYFYKAKFSSGTEINGKLSILN